jgi:hypothetical protein
LTGSLLRSFTVSEQVARLFANTDIADSREESKETLTLELTIASGGATRADINRDRTWCSALRWLRPEEKKLSPR